MITLKTYQMKKKVKQSKGIGIDTWRIINEIMV
jgi:hypothetical protein